MAVAFFGSWFFFSGKCDGGIDTNWRSTWYSQRVFRLDRHVWNNIGNIFRVAGTKGDIIGSRRIIIWSEVDEECTLFVWKSSFMSDCSKWDSSLFFRKLFCSKLPPVIRQNMGFHFPSALVGSIVAGSGFLLIHRELSHRKRLTTKWELQEYAENQWKEWRSSASKNLPSDSSKVKFLWKMLFFMCYIATNNFDQFFFVFHRSLFYLDHAFRKISFQLTLVLLQMLLIHGIKVSPFFVGCWKLIKTNKTTRVIR